MLTTLRPRITPATFRQRLMLTTLRQRLMPTTLCQRLKLATLSQRLTLPTLRQGRMLTPLRQRMTITTLRQRMLLTTLRQLTNNLRSFFIRKLLRSLLTLGIAHQSSMLASSSYLLCLKYETSYHGCPFILLSQCLLNAPQQSLFRLPSWGTRGV